MARQAFCNVLASYVWDARSLCMGWRRSGWSCERCRQVCLVHVSAMRGAQGLATQTVNWGAWAGHGMAAKAGLERMARLGFGAVQPTAGMSALGCLLRSLGAAGCGAQLLASCFLWDRCATPAAPASAAA